MEATEQFERIMNDSGFVKLLQISKIARLLDGMTTMLHINFTQMYGVRHTKNRLCYNHNYNTTYSFILCLQTIKTKLYIDTQASLNIICFSFSRFILVFVGIWGRRGKLIELTISRFFVFSSLYSVKNDVRFVAVLFIIETFMIVALPVSSN